MDLLDSVLTKALIGAGIAALAVIAAVLLRPLLAEGHTFVLRTPKWQRVVLGVFFAVAVAFGGGKTNQTDNAAGGTTNAPTMMASGGGADIGEAEHDGAIERSEIGAALPASSPLVTNLTTALCLSGPRSSFLTSDEDVASPLGFASSLNVASSLAENAAMVRNINLRGAWDDTFRLTFDADWVFPYGTSHLAAVQVDTQGKVRPWWNVTNAIASLGVPLAIVPGLTAFACERTTNNSYLVSWTNGAANRDTNTLVTAAIELFRNGDTRVTTNDVVRFTPREIPFPYDGFGQDADWVRANFTNATDILAVGYDEWVDNQVGVGFENGLYKFTATFTSAPPEATQLTVGEWTVCVTNAGDYVFLLEKGIEYSFNTSPFNDSVEFSMQDDVGPDAEVVYPVFSIFNSPFSILSSWWGEEDDPYGRWTVNGGWHWIYCPLPGWAGYCLWQPRFRGSPDVPHYGPQDVSITFTANLSDYRYAQSVAYHWTCDDENVVICSPNERSTEIRFLVIPSWNATVLRATATVAGEELVSELRFSYGVNAQPQVHLGLTAPSALLLNSNRVDVAKLGAMALSFSSDVETNGLVRISCVSGSDRLAAWGSTDKTSAVSVSHEWDVDDFSGMTAWLEGVRTSESVGDVRLRAEFVPEEGPTVSVERTLTVIEAGDITLPGAPDDGLVVLRGTSVAFEVGVTPSDAAPLVSTLWETRRLRGDGSYDDWTYAAANYNGSTAVYTPTTGGIYQVRARVGVGPFGVDERCYVWDEDENHDVGLGRKGALKAFGVCDEEWQVAVRNCASQNIGSSEYASDKEVVGKLGFSSIPDGPPKCNIFVAHMIISAGLTCPVLHRGTLLMDRYPPRANEWCSQTVEIEGWISCPEGEFPQPGYVSALHGSEMGHCGILDFDGFGISAQGHIITRRSKALSIGRFRRYQGGCGE